jgi:O-antigen ligase
MPAASLGAAAPARPLAVRQPWPWLDRPVAGLHDAVLLALVAAIFFLTGPDAEYTFTWLTGALAVTLSARLWRSLPDRVSGAGRWPWRAILPYALFAVIWLIAWRVHPGAGASQELTRQACFLVIVASIAVSGRAPLVLAVVAACLVLTAEQVAGPRSVESFAGRYLHYRGLEHWSGYPEIGLLMSMGATASIALLVAARTRTRLRLAALVLTAGFAGASVALFSRSAMLTIAVAAVWMLTLIAIRLRSRPAAVVLALVLIGGATAATTWERARSSVQAFARLEGWETDTRAHGWGVALAMLKDHPFAGVGPTRYPEAYSSYAAGEDRAHAYNVFLHTGAELGLVGLAASLWMWARVLIVTGRAAASGMPGLGALVVHAMLIAFLLRSQAEHFLANLPTSFRMMFLLAILFGLAEAFGRRADQRSAASAPTAPDGVEASRASA